MFPPSTKVVLVRHRQGRGVYEITGSWEIPGEIRNIKNLRIIWRPFVAATVESNRIRSRYDSPFKARRETR